MKKLLAGGCALAVLTLCGVFYWASTRSREPKTYAELIAMPPDRLAAVDVARMNMLCGEGLPGADDLDISQILGVFDQWAGYVRQNEKKYSSQYDKNPERYDHSYAKFQAVNLGLTLKDDLKCGYNRELIESGSMADIRSTRFFRNSSDLFLHGYVADRKGSCSSLPVLMVAIGRRCGYPLACL